MKLLVTGGAGYIGSVTTAVLLKAGHDVVVLDDLSTGHRDAVPSAATLIVSDITGAGAVLAGGRFDAVLHFAAYSLVGESVTDPHVYWRNNVGGSLALLQAIREAAVPRLVFSSTAAVYGDPQQVPITEDAPVRPTNPYGASKLSVDMMISSYAAAYGLGAVSLRYFNVAGAYAGLGERHTTETHLIPLILQVAAGRRDTVRLSGTDWPTPDGTCIRDYIHVADLAQAHVLALHAAVPGHHRIYNLGNGVGFSVRDVVAAARRVTGHALPCVPAPPRPGDPAVLVASNARVNAELGWRPQRPDLTTMVADAWAFMRGAVAA
ncbi:UDP-glucose 4-epimerase GalE [Frankia sp. Cr1]|uniref:UDP-glucose 4-epimerase GalE n=1 Tax=Frankia sp. Cr1 TaxID=3073931 RepID=UPI002AD3DB3E|nr:UDP-glucose 4-epimerase GalE [Frankia sp. Cr1]